VLEPWALWVSHKSSPTPQKFVALVFGSSVGLGGRQVAFLECLQQHFLVAPLVSTAIADALGPGQSLSLVKTCIQVPSQELCQLATLVGVSLQRGAPEQHQ